MSKHTPGPWRADWDDNGQWYIEPLGVTGNALRGDSGDCLESANAHLIAAAPDFYAVCKEIADHLYDEQDYARVREMARAAIAKAEGGAL